jgi:ribosomal protein L7/L12
MSQVVIARNHAAASLPVIGSMSAEDTNWFPRWWQIQAVRRCRELTGASLQEARVIIDSL